MANPFAVGLVVGVGLKWLSPYVLPVIGAVVRPLARVNIKPVAKVGIKVSWMGIERGRELIAYVGETVQDAMAEARAEIVRDANPPMDKA